MSQHSTAWVDVLAKTLVGLPARSAVSVTQRHEFFKRTDFKHICDEIESELSRAGLQLSDSEWQATKLIMKSIYKKTKSAYKNGYDFFQYALTPHLDDQELKVKMVSPTIRRGVELWCSMLGWRRASIVNWTSVEAAIARSTSSRYPHTAHEFAVRLEGLGKPATGPGHGSSLPHPLVRQPGLNR